MAGSSEFVETILDLLSRWGGVSARPMFSGHGLYRDGVMFGLIFRDTLYLKVDERDRPEFIAKGMAPFTYGRRRRTISMPGYYEAPPELFDDGEDMIRWSARALDAALRIRQSKRPRRRAAT